VDPTYPEIKSCVTNTRSSADQGDAAAACQESNLKVPISNEPAKCNPRASRPKKPLDKKEFLWY